MKNVFVLAAALGLSACTGAADAPGTGSAEPPAAGSAKAPDKSAPAASAPRSAPKAAEGAAAQASQQPADSPCPAICARSRELACARAAECDAACAASFSDDLCDKEVRAAAACMVREPASHWECDEGLAVIKEGFCMDEQAAVASCVQRVLQ